MNARIRQFVVGSLLVIAVAACGSAATTPSPVPASAFAIRTPAVRPQACMDALMTGSLERHPQTGLGIGTAEGVSPVEWPFGYSARVVGGSIVLLDRSGKVVAREHDRVHAGGGIGNGSLWFACGDITVESNIGG